jgi:hypothetical protein
MNINFLKDFLRYKKYQYLKFKKHNHYFVRNKSINNYINEINKKGYVIIKNFFNKSECEKIIRIIDKFIQDKPSMVWRDKIGSDFRIHGAENISIEMNNLVKKKIKFSKKSR